MNFWGLVQKIWEGFKQTNTQTNRLHDQVHLIVTDENFLSGTKKIEEKREGKKEKKKVSDIFSETKQIAGKGREKGRWKVWSERKAARGVM